MQQLQPLCAITNRQNRGRAGAASIRYWTKSRAKRLNKTCLGRELPVAKSYHKYSAKHGSPPAWRLPFPILTCSLYLSGFTC